MEASEERRNRLKGIRESAQAEADGGEAVPAAVPAVKFRNYKLRDTGVQHEKVEAAKVPELSVPVPETDQLLTQQEIIEAYAPKKPHMDLKRDCAKRIAKLERRTQHALRELAQELQDGTLNTQA